MMYLSPNFTTKPALRRALAEGKVVRLHDNSPDAKTQCGEFAVAGPAFPQQHKWTATVLVHKGRVIKVIE